MLLLHNSKQMLTQYITQQKDGLKATLSPRAVIPAGILKKRYVHEAGFAKPQSEMTPL